MPPIVSTTNLEIPARYNELRSAISHPVFSIVQAVEAASPGHRFGQRAFQHSTKLADEASCYASKEGFSTAEAGVLMLTLFCEDIGRHIAALPFEERMKYIPDVYKLDPDWKDDAKAQHRHGELSVYFLREHNLLAGLEETERNLIEEAVWHHSTQVLKLDPTHPAYIMCRIARDIDKSDILLRADFTTSDGFLGQFIQWRAGVESSTTSKHHATQILSENQELKASIKAFLDSMFNPDYEKHVQVKAELQTQVGLERDLVNEVIAWSDTKPRGELLLRVKDSFRASPPASFSKPEMIENYSTYMLAQTLMALEISSTSVRAKLQESSSVIDRFRYIRFVLGAVNYDAYIAEFEQHLFQKS